MLQSDVLTLQTELLPHCQHVYVNVQDQHREAVKVFKASRALPKGAQVKLAELQAEAAQLQGVKRAAAEAAAASTSHILDLQAELNQLSYTTPWFTLSNSHQQVQ